MGRFMLVWFVQYILTKLARGPTATDENDSDSKYTPPGSPDVEQATKSTYVDCELSISSQEIHLPFSLGPDSFNVESKLHLSQHPNPPQSISLCVIFLVNC